MLRFICALCLAAAPLVASSQQMIYKIQMPDGTVLYSDSVPSGGKIIEEREAKSTPRVTTLPSQPATKGGTPGQPTVITRPPGSPAPGTRSTAPAKSAPESVSAAERELAVAKRKLELGREPLPGERLGLKGGGSRLTPEYEARIAGMEREVASAETKLKRAYDAR